MGTSQTADANERSSSREELFLEIWQDIKNEMARRGWTRPRLATEMNKHSSEPFNVRSLYDRIHKGRGVPWETIRCAVLALGLPEESYKQRWERADRAPRQKARPPEQASSYEPDQEDPGSAKPEQEKAKLDGPGTPHQLPTSDRYFVGRDSEWANLTTQLDLATPRGDFTPIVCVVGTAGVGKTALAIRWAHEVSDRFPDGQLYVNLQGYSPDPPRNSADVLALFLNELGVPVEQIPGGQDAWEKRYRSLLTDKKLLVVLDNAATAEQVRPLLPGSSTCLVVVTSRSDLSSLAARHGAQSIVLDRLSEPEAVELFRRILGSARVDREPDAATALAVYCAHLPLALRVAAQRAATRPEWALAEIAAELAAEKRRLDLLATPDRDPVTDIRAVFSWSYHALSPEEARMFRLLGLHAGPEISVQAAEALAGGPSSNVRQLLETLVGLHLLERNGKDRYRFHDLLRHYAKERVADEEPQSARTSAVRRVLDWYLHTAKECFSALMPYLRPIALAPPNWPCPILRFDNPCMALYWCEIERVNLIAAIHQAVEYDEHVVATQLPAVLSTYFYIRKPWNDWIEACRIGITSAQRCGDRLGERWSLSSLGIAYWGLGRYEEAQQCHEHAVKICREIGDRWGEGMSANFLGDVYRDRGDPQEAISHYENALDICHEINERWGGWGAGFALHNLGHAYHDLGQYDKAVAYYKRVLKQADANGDDPWGKAQTLQFLGDAYQHQGQAAKAITCYRKTLALRHNFGDRHGEASTLASLASVAQLGGRTKLAKDSWRQALAIFQDLKDPRAGDIEALLQNKSGRQHEAK